MSIKDAYNQWSSTYDDMPNKTRDLDRLATRKTLSKYNFDTILELGCGTGKNTAWLVGEARHVIALDFSEEMLARAKKKAGSNNVEFHQVDITKAWPVEEDCVEFITCNLVLEHIENLDHIFSTAISKLKSGGHFFISELHPFKQYRGSKARFETANGTQDLRVFVHNVSAYLDAAKYAGFDFLELKEWWDEDRKDDIPRLISFLFKKS